MKIKFIGAAGGSVTGSCTHFIYPRTKTSFLVDCGLVQGEGDFESINSAPFPFDASGIQFVLLTHAHLDHCGLLPKLYRAGFTGEVICTAATAAIAKLSLMDGANYSGSLFSRQEVDAVRFKAIDGPDARISSAIFPVRKDLFVSFRRTGHIAGSASVTIGWVDDEEVHRYIVMSGDLGNNTKTNPYQPLLAHRRGIFGSPDAIVVESTYGDRVRLPEYKSYEDRIAALRNLVQREVFERKSILIIPAFAVQRTHELLFDLLVVFKRFFGSDIDSTAPVLPRGRFYEDFKDGCWTWLANAAIQRVLPTLPEQDQSRWRDAFEETGDSAYPMRIKQGHAGTAEELRDLIENTRLTFPVTITLDAKLARSMGAVLRQELMRRLAHKPEELASRNPELLTRLGLQSEEEFEALLRRLLPDPGSEAAPIEVGPHTIRFQDSDAIPSRGEAQLRGTILLTGGGMCEGGPVLSHLEKLSTLKRECVLVQTGYLAKYSLGKRLSELAFGNEPGQTKPSGSITIGTRKDIPHEDVHLRSADLSAYYSGHADQEGLLDFIFASDGRVPGGIAPQPATVFINHGNPVCRKALKEAIAQRAALDVPGDRAIHAVEVPAAGQQAFDLNLGEWVDDSEAVTLEVTLAALLREQTKTNELLRQVLQALTPERPKGPPTKAGQKKTQAR